MANPSEKRKSMDRTTRADSEEQEDPVPTQEGANGEMHLDPAAEHPAQDAVDHTDLLDASASQPPPRPVDELPVDELPPPTAQKSADR